MTGDQLFALAVVLFLVICAWAHGYASGKNDSNGAEKDE